MSASHIADLTLRVMRSGNSAIIPSKKGDSESTSIVFARYIPSTSTRQVPPWDLMICLTCATTPIL